MAKGGSTISQYQSLQSELDQKEYHPIYLLEGDEAFFIRQLVERFEKEILTPAEKSFNFSVHYGNETSPEQIIGAAKRFPMMAQKQVIIIKEAQQIRQLDKLLPYIEDPLDSTVLVLVHSNKSVNKNSKLGRALKKHKVFTSKKLYDNQVMPWLINFIRNEKLQADQRVVQLLYSAVGNDLMKLMAEVNKIKANLGERTQIELEDLEKNLGVHREYNVFEFQKAMGLRNFQKAMTIARFFGNNPKDNPLTVTITLLFNYFKKVHLIHFQKTQNPGAIASAIGMSPYFVDEYIRASQVYSPMKLQQIIGIISDYDLKMKGINASKVSEYELLRELIVKVIR
jgi:DNA polymerase III subunit delta